MKRQPAVPPLYFSFFDLDAGSEICHIPAKGILACPRVGEQVDYRADVEEGGGLYSVVNVRHILQRDAPSATARVSVARVVIELKPIHSAYLEQESAAVEIPVEELANVPVA